MCVGVIHRPPVGRGTLILSVVILNKLPNKQSSCRWFRTPWRSCSITVMPRASCLRPWSSLSSPPQLIPPIHVLPNVRCQGAGVNLPFCYCLKGQSIWRCQAGRQDHLVTSAYFKCQIRVVSTKSNLICKCVCGRMLLIITHLDCLWCTWECFAGCITTNMMQLAFRVT